MKKAITAIVCIVILVLMGLGYYSSMHHEKHELNSKETIFEHLGDAYGWEVPFNHHARIPLPVIVKGDDGWHCFMSNRITNGETYDGYRISDSEEHHGKVVQVKADGSECRPLDLSITKNVAGIIIAAIVVTLMVMAMKRWYMRNGMKAPRGAKGMIELVVEFVYGDTIRPILGKNAPKYAPYLLTVFFFILTMNLL